MSKDNKELNKNESCEGKRELTMEELEQVTGGAKLSIRQDDSIVSSNVMAADVKEKAVLRGAEFGLGRGIASTQFDSVSGGKPGDTVAKCYRAD